ncbi:hypothetical protein IMZ48_10635, partial [Candidatus Bathyarchaeota archaeon]|nr:hypothetical protein [Candidatus Bathyarchaeota archaeon]
VYALLGNFHFLNPRDDGVKLGLSHLRDMARLDRKDTQGMRTIIPGLHVSINED